jgi:two-component system, NtrC family, nitrogen regulation sensor histidine kinase GlnL
MLEKPLPQWSSLAIFEAFNHLATMVAVLRHDGQCVFVNTAFENVLGLSRRSVLQEPLSEWFVDPIIVQHAIRSVVSNEFSTRRFEALLRRSFGASLAHIEALPVLVVVNQMDPTTHAPWVLIELLEIEQQARQDRENRALEQAQANKELIRNLAHEIKNPLGGIRGAAQLLEMELASPALSEYTQVIIQEADRLQVLVDRLLAPHRKAHVVSDVNIHEVCERVRALVLAQCPQGLQVQRDYDTSIPEFRGDPEQLIQAVLNVAHNAVQALAFNISQGSACMVLRTRIARQVTVGKQRFKLALELHVQDNGPGVEPALREKIFYPLVSGRDGGTGLGLTLTQTFIQQHQGTIECDSEPGLTLFKILIPLP